EIEPNKSIKRRTGRKIVAVTIALAVVAVGLFVYQMVRPDRRQGVEGGAPATPQSEGLAGARPSIPAKRIAVLPFDTPSRDGENDCRGVAGKTYRFGKNFDGENSDGESGSLRALSQREILLEQADRRRPAQINRVSQASDRQRPRLRAGLCCPSRFIWPAPFLRWSFSSRISGAGRSCGEESAGAGRFVS